MTLHSSEHLEKTLGRIDRRGYKAYKDLEGSYRFPGFQLFIDHVQGDPFASPSRVRVRVSQGEARFPRELFSSRVRCIALEDYLTREFDRAVRELVKGNRGTGKSGAIFIDRGGQEVLERTSMRVNRDFVEARVSLGLPARGRSVSGGEAREMFFKELPRLVERALFYEALPAGRIQAQVQGVEDQEYLREELARRGLVAFIGNGSRLPRLSGISDLPLPGEGVVLFQSPPGLEVTLDLPNGGPVRGMGIPTGVTLVVGGGYHGKSTLLRAIERGVYPHVPGDGRELVVSLGDTVKIRAEDGRRVEKVNISPFINNLPLKKGTGDFSTPEASGSTSQAANIMEALEMGAKVLLLDEDTSATNFMIRDVRMQALVAREREPITPFIDKVQLLKKDLGVSTIMVLGGSGDYFDVADTVIMMEEYRPREVTRQAREIARRYQTGRQPEGGKEFGALAPRVPTGGGLDPTRGRKTKVAGRGLHQIQYGTQDIDLSLVEQLVDPSQTRAIGEIIHFSRRLLGGRGTLEEIIQQVLRQVEEQGLEVISPFRGQHPGDYALPRKYEIAAAFNRLRSFQVRQQGEAGRGSRER